MAADEPDIPSLDEQQASEPNATSADIAVAAAFHAVSTGACEMQMSGADMIIDDSNVMNVDTGDDEDPPRPSTPPGPLAPPGATLGAAASRVPASRKPTSRACGAPPADVWKKRSLVPRATPLGPLQRVAATASLMTTAYFLPEDAVRQASAMDTLAKLLTAKPLSKRYQGRETKHPWSLLHRRLDGSGRAWLAMPRGFGQAVLGRAATVRVSAGEPLNPQLGPPVLPLLDAVTGPQMNKVDQVRAVDALEQQLRADAERYGHAGRLFCLSPSFGKTCCAAHLIRRLGRRTLFVVPNRDFIVQVSDELRHFLGPELRVGHMTCNTPRKWKVADQDVVLTTFASLSEIEYDLQPYGLVIVDEVHEAVTPSYSKMFYRCPAVYMVGLTATPERSDHCGAYLQWLIGPIAWHEMKDIRDTRWGCVHLTVYNMHYARYPLVEMRGRGADGAPVVYEEGMLRQLFSKFSRNRFLLDEVVLPRVREGRRIIMLGTRVKHMELMLRELELRGVSVGLVVGKPSEGPMLTEQQKALAKSKQVLIMTASIGYKALNIPELDTLVVLAPPYVNDTWWTQASGRITRDLPSKKQPEIVFMRDQYVSTLRTADGVFASMADKACRTLLDQSSGYVMRMFNVHV